MIEPLHTIVSVAVITVCCVVVGVVAGLITAAVIEHWFKL